MPYQRILSRDSTAVLSITLIWVLTELLINPSGNFPLNDDWSYALSLRSWYDTHHYHLIGWTSMPLLTQLSWGLLFCKIFGFSFTVLRYSTLVLGLVGGIGAYFLSREFSDNKPLCFLAALILLLNPLYLNLANSFMTDVPFTSLLVLSLLFFVKALRQNGQSSSRSRLSYILQAVFFVLAATMIRQLGLFVAVAFCFTLLVKEGFTKKYILTSALVMGLPLGAYLLYNHWIRVEHNFPIKYNEGFRRIQNNLLGKDHSAVQYLLRQALNIFVYAGFFTFPFIFRTDWNIFWKKRTSPAVLTCIAVIIGAGLYCLVYRANMPLMGNILNPYGLGPLNLRDIILLHMDHVQPLPAILRMLFCLAGIIGGGFLLLALINIAGDLWKKRQLPLMFLLSFTLLYLGMMLVGGTYDRYLIPLIPILLILLMTALPEKAVAASGDAPSQRTRPAAVLRYAALASLLAGAWFSIAGTANYLSWNRARWDALRYLTYKAGIPPSQIDGGFEFNGYYGYTDEDISYLKDNPDHAPKSWWWVKDDTYQVSFGPLEGYTVLQTFPCHSALFPFPKEDIFVLKKNP